jgi:xanthine dehydrogenase YagR molybdenum-binding subunit
VLLENSLCRGSALARAEERDRHHQRAAHDASAVFPHEAPPLGASGPVSRAGTRATAEPGASAASRPIRIRRIFAAYDVGRVVNPKLAHSQAIGGMVAGIGMSLLEQAMIDQRDGRTVNANLADYLVAVNADVPNVDAVFLNGDDPIADPLGVKGLGEVVIVGVPASISNAVFNVTGYRATEFPITLEKLL